MTTIDRDQLRAVLYDTICTALDDTVGSGYTQDDAEYVLDAALDALDTALLAAGVTLPRRIETVEELDALPKHTTIVTFYDCVIQLGEATGRGWRVGFVPGVGPMRTVSVSDLPAIVLWTPGGAQ
ncbi:hypothetical protein F8M49_30000 [Rhodococcus zopfii]|uniref:Uncharacterized protein n=1 Tax=Rhodococcus zopfii TaxID=43772 RepID=A0ABU3WX98_9NOCA|nr:hypothetical protein [Rhodococcus zopfii]MDV2478595.1 hypothetical protein [Rhodococcus zopfii]